MFWKLLSDSRETLLNYVLSISSLSVTPSLQYLVLTILCRDVLCRQVQGAVCSKTEFEKGATAEYFFYLCSQVLAGSHKMLQTSETAFMQYFESLGNFLIEHTMFGHKFNLVSQLHSLFFWVRVLVTAGQCNFKGVFVNYQCIIMFLLLYFITYAAKSR